MDGKVIIETELNTKSFEEEIRQTENKLNELEKAYQKAMNPPKGMEVNKKAIQNLRVEIEKTSNKLVDLRSKQVKLGEAPPSNVTEWLKNTGKEVENNIKKIGRWALAIFGIRGAYMAVRNAMNTILANDDQLKADIDYMKNVIAYMLEPVVRTIVGLMKQLMFYVGYIAKAWFGINIYANASEKAMKAGAKSAKEMKKQLAGFDEMNVLGDSSGGNTAGATVPSFDLGNMEDIPVPSWLQWIADNKDEVIAGLAGIAGGLIAVKNGLSGIQALGIGVSIAGLVYAIEGVLNYLKDPTWSNFGQIIQGIGVFVIGLGVAFLGLPGIITGVITLIVGTIIKYWDEIKQFLLNIGDWLTDKIDWVRKHLGEQIGTIYETFVTAFKGIVIGLETTFQGFKQILDGIIQFIKGVFTGNWKQAWEGIKNIFFGIFNSLKGIVVTVFSFISGLVVSIAQTVGYTIADAFKAIVNGILWAIESTLNAPIKAVNKLIGVINKVPGIDLGTLPTFKLPRLARGGIVNNPGAGVMMGSYIAGEKGAEAVLPLTDDTLQRLANMMPITVNLTNTMNGRVISRELKKVQNENSFAYNG